MSKNFSVVPQTKWTADNLWTVERNSMMMLLISLVIAGFGDGLIVLADLGSSPWTVLSQGIALQSDISIGWASFMISCTVMLLWFPLRLRLGLGTILNILFIALALGVTVAYFPAPSSFLQQGLYVVIGLIFFGAGTALYLTCHLGAGPRDGLMVGLCQRFCLKVALVRSLLEVSVCLAGWLLGGTVGIGTLLFALSIGWIVQCTLMLVKRF